MKLSLRNILLCVLFELHKIEADFYAIPKDSNCASYNTRELLPQTTGVKGKYECMLDCILKNCSFMKNLDDGSCIIGGLGRHKPQTRYGVTSAIFKYSKEEFFLYQTDVALNKPTGAAPLYSSSYPSKNGNDGNFNSFYHSSLQINRPWWFVDLQKTFKIYKITINGRRNLARRHNTLKFYVTEDLKLDETGRPNVTSLPLFSEQKTSPVNTEQTIHEKPEGMCGRYIIVIRDLPKGSDNPLEIAHVNAEGDVILF